MDKSESLARVERITRAILSSEDGGVPLSRFEGDYRRMTKTQFPWRDYDFKSARDMLISMEKAVEFKFNDEEGQFYLLPVHVTITSNGTLEGAHARGKQFSNGDSRVQHSSSGYSANTDVTADSTMPSLVETVSDPMDDMFTVDQYGRVSVYVTQSREKPAMNYWNKQNLTKLFSPFGNIVNVMMMSNKKSGFVRYWTTEEAKRAVKELNNKLISADGNKLIVRPGVSKQQKIGQPIMNRQNDMLNKKQPLVTKSVTTKMVTKVTDEALDHHTTDDEDDVWDDGLLPKNVCCNGSHDNKGIENGMEALNVYSDSVTLLEMYVTEVISPGLLWLRDTNMGGRDLQYISLAIEMQHESLKKLDTWKLPKEGAAYCINVREVNKDDKSGIKWSRVIVNKVFQSSEQVEVRYVDTGVMGTLSMTHLYVLPLSCQLRELPPNVMPCHLWGVASNHDNREWWPLDCQLLWSLIRNKKVFAKIRSDIFAKLKNDAFANIRNNVIHNVEQCVPVELFFDADGKDDVRDHLINKGHFIVLTDINANRSQDDSSSDDNLSTPSQEETTAMWRPSPIKANTDPLPKQPHSITQSHNQSLPVTSPLMWRPTRLTPNSLSFSDQ